MAEKMKVLVKEPGKPAEVREIENTLEACQTIVYAEIRAEQLPAYKIGGSYRIEARALENYLFQRRTKKR